MISYVKKGMAVFDVGANQGNKTQQYLNLGCSVVAIEPNPNLHDSLKKRFGDQIEIEPCAMGSAAGKLPLFICRDSNGNPLYNISSMSKEFREETHKHRFNCYGYAKDDFVTVPVATLDALIEKHGQPDFIKIDVEGFELEALKGLSSPVKIVSIEFTPELYDNAAACIKRFLEISPEYRFNYSSQETDLRAFNVEVDAATMLHFLGKIKDWVVEYGDIYAVLR